MYLGQPGVSVSASSLSLTILRAAQKKNIAPNTSTILVMNNAYWRLWKSIWFLLPVNVTEVKSTGIVPLAKSFFSISEI